ncbi:MAG: 50S ribosomal protein L29 [Parcubacteria group bacterium]
MKLTVKELKGKTVEELRRLYRELSAQRQDLNFRAASKQLKDVREIREARLNIARILTLVKERGEKI